MHELTDEHQIRGILETDRPWSAYALADLEPDAAAHTAWFAAPRGVPALALLYRAFNTPVLIVFGRPADLHSVLDEVEAALGDAEELYCVVRPEVLPLLAERYHIPQPRLMHRMLLNAKRFRPQPMEGVVELGPSDLNSVEQLLADGMQSGEAPEFFIPSMLEQGMYRGVREGSNLIAAGGTHVLTASASVAAIGNIYTRRDRRRRGLGGRVTYSVTARLLQMGFQTIVLNVRQINTEAVRLYESLGFEHYFDYYEAPAFRRG